MNFNKDKIIKFFVSIIICQSAGAIGSAFTISEIGGWYATLNKPFFNPPNWIFGPVWSFLFLLMGISFYIVWEKKFSVKVLAKEKELKIWNHFSKKLWVGSWKEENVVVIFFLQLVLNILWSVVFFGMHSPATAFFEILMLWFAIFYTIINFYRISKIASYLLIPYILWVSFAVVLNCFIWILN